MKGFCLLVVGTATIHQAAGIVTVVGTGHEWDSSTYVYHGPQSPEVEGPAIWMNSFDTCCYVYDTCDKDAWSAQVLGKIVVLDLEAPCNLQLLYPAFIRAGATALINTRSYSMPGLWAFQHESPFPPFDTGTGDSCFFCDETVPLIEVSNPNRALERELNKVGAGAVVRISLPHLDLFEKSYRSAAWTVVFRIMAPLFALLTSFLAAQEVYPMLNSKDRRDKKWSIGHIICAIECSCLFIVAAALSLGQYGPTVLDLRTHLALQNLLMGFSVFTTVLLALVMHNTINKMKPRTAHIFTEYPRFLAVIILTTAVVDSFVVVISLTPLMSAGYGIHVLVFVILFVPLQFGISVFFLDRAWKFRRFAFFYLKNDDIDQLYFRNHASEAQRIGRLAFWLAASGVMMVVTCISFATALAMYSAVADVDVTILFVSKGVFVFSRIGVSYAQVRAVSQGSKSMCSRSRCSRNTKVAATHSADEECEHRQVNSASTIASRAFLSDIPEAQSSWREVFSSAAWLEMQDSTTTTKLCEQDEEDRTATPESEGKARPADESQNARPQTNH